MVEITQPGLDSGDAVTSIRADSNPRLTGDVTFASGTNITLSEVGQTITINGSAAGVTSVSGTTNRITSSGGTTPVIDISAAYVGQSSITTVGTLSAGAVPASLVTAGTFGTGNYNFNSTANFLGGALGTGYVNTLAANITGTPYMTSNSTPSPYVAVASSEANSSNAAWKAFDGDLTSKWSSNFVPTGTLAIDTGGSYIVSSYAITGPVSGDATFAPKTWTFEGSNDNSNWTVLDTQTNVANWSAIEQRFYAFANVTAYRYFRLNVTANKGGSLLEIVELAIPISAFPKTSLISGSILNGGTSMTVGQTGDALGSSYMIFQNRSGSGGAIFYNTGSDLVDFGFHANSGQQSNMRFEHRSSNVSNTANVNGEFQFFDSTHGQPPWFNTGAVTSCLLTGNMGFGIKVPTSNLHVFQPTAGVGTVAVSGTAVTGTGTQFTNTFKVGDTITVTTTSGSETKTITTVTDNSHLVTAAFTGTAAAGTAYTLVGGTIFTVSGNGNVAISNQATIGGKVIAGDTVRLKGYTVATLPAGTQGDTAFVTDALAPTFLATIVGGGAIVTPVFYDGTNWVAH